MRCRSDSRIDKTLNWLHKINDEVILGLSEEQLYPISQSPLIPLRLWFDQIQGSEGAGVPRRISALVRVAYDSVQVSPHLNGTYLIHLRHLIRGLLWELLLLHSDGDSLWTSAHTWLWLHGCIRLCASVCVCIFSRLSERVRPQSSPLFLQLPFSLRVESEVSWLNLWVNQWSEPWTPLGLGQSIWNLYCTVGIRAKLNGKHRNRQNEVLSIMDVFEKENQSSVVGVGH